MEIEHKKLLNTIVNVVQRYLINTIFDSVNSILGVVIGLYLAGTNEAFVFMMSILSTAIALGISSGTSTYEAEYMEQMREIKDLEQHMIIDIQNENPQATKKAKWVGIAVGIANFLTPLIVALLFIIFLLIIPALQWAFWIIIGASALLLFVAGLIFGKINQLSPIKRGLRMLLIGGLTFAIVYLVGIIF